MLFPPFRFPFRPRCLLIQYALEELSEALSGGKFRALAGQQMLNSPTEPSRSAFRTSAKLNDKGPLRWHGCNRWRVRFLRVPFRVVVFPHALRVGANQPSGHRSSVELS